MGSTPYNRQAVTGVICDRIADGKSLRSVCDSDDSLPAWRTFLAWVAEDDDLAQQYARAMAERCDAIGEEILEISDDARNDYMEMLADENDSPGMLGYKLNGEHVQRSKLRVDARKWFLSKLAPKKYGDSTLLKHADADGNQLQALIAQISGGSLTPGHTFDDGDAESENGE